MNSAAIVLFAALTAQFSQEVGKIRPELHSSGFGPTICSQTQQDLEDVKSMGFTAARTHDWALINSNERVCDYFHIFPLMYLDAKDPKNYVFGPTDYLLKRTREETGLQVFYRLGTSIEHSGKKIHFNSLIPEDFDKVAEIFAGTIRHYNRGWANGYEWGIKYWELWNEPDIRNSMWCLPGGDGEGRWENPGTAGGNWAKRRELFIRFYVTCLKRLKGEFGDSIKVGGPALAGYREDYFRKILTACREAGVAPDFISWHGYANDPLQYNREAEKARALCDSFGFTKCELIVNEWHYFGENYDWNDMQHCSDPVVKARIWTGPDSHNGIRSTAFTLAALANMQRSKLDQAYYYGCRHTGDWGFKDGLQSKYKVFYGLQLFGKIVHEYDTICDSTSEGSVTLLPVLKKATGRKGLLVIDYGGASRQLTVQVPDAKAVESVTLLDNAHDLTSHKAEFNKGVLKLQKPDFHSAVFFVTFKD